MYEVSVVLRLINPYQQSGHCRQPVNDNFMKLKKCKMCQMCRMCKMCQLFIPLNKVLAPREPLKLSMTDNAILLRHLHSTQPVINWLVP